MPEGPEQGARHEIDADLTAAGWIAQSAQELDLTLDDSALWKVQEKAIRNLEPSFADAHPRALIQMATGSGKTYTSLEASGKDRSCRVTKNA